MQGYFRFIADPQEPGVAASEVSDADQMWMVRKAAEIYRATGCTWLGARLEAEAQFVQRTLGNQHA